MKPLDVVPVTPPPADQRVRRNARFAAPGERKTRYTLPDRLVSHSPVGYRTRVSLTRDEVARALALLSLRRPTSFVTGPAPTDAELFDESALGVLSARQSTNYRGQRQVGFGPDDSRRIAEILRTLDGREAPVLDGATHTWVVWCRPYRTPFTQLLTFIGHQPVRSLLTVPRRAWRKKVHHEDDIPTIGFLTDLHVGILADAMERAAVIASDGGRRAQVHLAPFTGRFAAANRDRLAALWELSAVGGPERRAGWRVAMVVQVGWATPDERVDLPRDVARKLGANLVAFRSERIQPGVNHEEKAPAAYQVRQDVDVPDALVEQCGRAAYNAFAHWTGVDRERSKDLLLLERVDVLSPTGKRRLREIRGQLEDITDRVVKNLPLWADLPLGRALSRNAARGRKAFALAGQRIYIVGLSKRDIERANLDWTLAIRAVGAACARSALYAELMGVTDIPPGCDLLAGVCLMAGPVNQNDVGKQFFGVRDLLAEAFADRDPTSLLVWTLKAKTVADPIGNEEQLLDEARKGALVDLRPGPHDVVALRIDGAVLPFRQRDGRISTERAFGDVGNFLGDPDGREIEGNRGAVWPAGPSRPW
jgi:hypothetical protein